MPRRHQSRECALQILYLMDAAQLAPDNAIRTFWADFARDESVREYAEAIVNGVAGARDDLDALIEHRSLNWRVARMSIVDRNILRIAAWEMRHSEVPVKVAIDEAVELAKRFGAEDSRAFVNGILDAMMEDVGAAKAGG